MRSSRRDDVFTAAIGLIAGALEVSDIAIGLRQIGGSFGFHGNAMPLPPVSVPS
jgi:hypothetical protein